MRSQRKNKLIVILGPTASGKTDLSVKLAKKYDGEIISADSRQIYKEMDVGTAKITQKEMFGIPHHLIDIVKPDKTITLSQYKQKAVKIIKDIQSRGKIPFFVGGTGLYIQAVVENLFIPKIKPDENLRKTLEQKTNTQLLKQLKKLDPQTTAIIDPKNKRRIIRALEVSILSGKPFSFLRTKGRPIFDTIQIGINVSRGILYKRINQRVEQQVKSGLIEEVKKLGAKYGWNFPSMSGIGYKEFKLFIENNATLKKSKNLLKQNTRNYAKRQMTWFKKNKTIHWIKNEKEAKKLIKDFLK